MIASLSLILAYSPNILSFGKRATHTFRVGVHPSLLVHGTNGKITVRRGPDGEIFVKELTLADELDKLGQVRNTLSSSTEQVSIQTIESLKPNPSGYRDSYSPPIVKTTIYVPRNTKLQLETYNGDIEVTGVAGESKIKSYNGTIQFEAQSNQVDSIHAETRNGKLSAAVPVNVALRPSVDLQTYNGNVSVTKTEPSLELQGGLYFNGKSFEDRPWYVVDGLFTKLRPQGPIHSVPLNGKYVVPAYADAHCHHFDGEPFSRIMDRRYLAEGTLFAQSMGNHASGRAGAEEVVNHRDAMDVTFANQGFTSENGHPMFLYESLAHPLPSTLSYKERSDQIKGRHTQLGDAYWVVDTPQQLEQAWPKFLAGDPDIVKIFLVNSAHREENKMGFAGSFGLDPAMIGPIVSRAHEAGLKVYAHVDTAYDLELALSNGVDSLGHMPGYGYQEGSTHDIEISPKQAQLASGKYVQATMSIGSFYNRANPAVGDTLRRKNFDQLVKHRAKMLIGSDSYGSTSINEVETWLKLGIGPEVLLRSLCTDTPRSIFPNRVIGAISEGYEANFNVLPKDPLVNPGYILKPDSVWKLGLVVYSQKGSSSK